METGDVEREEQLREKRQIWVVGSREKGMEEFPSCPDESKQFSVKTADNWVQL